jgi:isoleucyl-tRNA synthetase
MEAFNPLKLEQEIMQYWDGINLFRKIRDSSKGGKKFYYLDGPPYVNGDPHMGHARTRAIRDAILKHRVMKGYDVNLQPGYDCHGLPIEVKVEEELGLKKKEDILEFGAEKFIDKCRERALHFVDVFNLFYKRFGLHWDFEKPYKTLDQSYINASWIFFKNCDEKGLLYKGKATTAWCPRCQTALAGYEATDEYRDVSDNSIYVKFPISGKPGEFILIWTTTPWTLPANLAVTINPKYEYVFVKAGKEKWLMAKELVEKVAEACGIVDYEISGEAMKGEDIEGMKYDFLLADSVPANKELDKGNKRVHTILLGDFVTLEDGTGCVHTAPGHGQDDYSIGMKYGLPPFSPVGENGLYTDEGGSLKGTHVFKANDIIVDLLKSRDLLAGEQKIMHRYAHCWRCKTPIIYRASPQWFVSVDKVKDLMVKENKKVKWLPEWAGEKRFANWIEEARDWCISRQRYWGIPLPIWECECGERQVFGSFEELKEAAIKLPEGEADLHVPYTNKIKVRCEKCNSEMNRVPDITDIWFESGAATWASLGYPQEKALFENMFPMDFITEGLDQTRGWFYTIMLEGIIMFGQAPYRNVLMNEWVLDKNGDKMSKSLGNVIAPGEVMDKYGADITRFYLLSETEVWEKLKFNMENVKITFRLFNTIWNCHQFLKTYMDAAGLNQEALKVAELETGLKPEDRWILSRLASIGKEVEDSLEGYLPFSAAKSLEGFVMEDLSRWYIKIIRDRAWVSAEEGDRNAAIGTLYIVMSGLSKLMAPFAPFISEYIYRDLCGGESVFLGGWQEGEINQDKELEKQMALAKEIVEQLNAARGDAGIKLRWPIESMTISSKEDLSRVSEVICTMSNSKKLVFSETEPDDAVVKEFSAGRVMLSRKRSKEIIEEGLIRDLMRQIQNMRKKEGLDVSEKVVLSLWSDEEFSKAIEKFKSEIASGTTAKEVFVSQGKPESFREEAKFEGKVVWIDYSK